LLPQLFHFFVPETLNGYDQVDWVEITLAEEATSQLCAGIDCGVEFPAQGAEEYAPSLSVSKLVQYLKGRSSRKLQMEFEELRRGYWGQHLWARGYFCATVGAVTDEMIQRYVEEQKWDEDGGKGFKVVPD